MVDLKTESTRKQEKQKTLFTPRNISMLGAAAVGATIATKAMKAKPKKTFYDNMMGGIKKIAGRKNATAAIGLIGSGAAAILFYDKLATAVGKISSNLTKAPEAVSHIMSKMFPSAPPKIKPTPVDGFVKTVNNYMEQGKNSVGALSNMVTDAVGTMSETAGKLKPIKDLFK